MTFYRKTNDTPLVSRTPKQEGRRRHRMLHGLGLGIAVMMLSLVAWPSDDATAAVCTPSLPPDVCSAALCTPWVGTAPTYDASVCCDTTNTCYSFGRGCASGQTEYHAYYGELESTGTVRVYMELAPRATSSDSTNFCCNGANNTCTIYVGGCDGSNEYTAWCDGDVLILDDGSAYCYQDDC